MTRTHKGKSMLAFPDSYIVVDIETTGLSPDSCSVIELAALKVDAHKIVDRFDTLIQPEEYCMLPPGVEASDYAVLGEVRAIFVDAFIKNLTGITNRMLQDAPRAAEVLPEFAEFIGDAPLLAHNAHFDVNFLYDAFLRFLGIPLCNHFVDTLRLGRRLLPELRHHRLADLAQYFSVDDHDAHRALRDCEITYDCYQGLARCAAEQYGSVAAFIAQCGGNKS